jgi:hypothetical protein
LYPDSTHTLLSYRDIRKNGLHVVTHEENNEEFLHIIKKNGDDHYILKRIPSLPSGLYYTYIKHISHVAYKIIFQNVDAFTTWHERIGPPGVGMMRKIISISTGHNLNSVKFPKSLNFMCTTYATGKLIVRLSVGVLQTGYPYIQALSQDRERGMHPHIAMSPAVPDPASQLGRAPALPRVQWL